MGFQGWEDDMPYSKVLLNGVKEDNRGTSAADKRRMPRRRNGEYSAKVIARVTAYFAGRPHRDLTLPQMVAIVYA